MRTTSCGACARADAKADRTGSAEATARRRRLVRMRSDMAPLLRACAPCGGAGAYSGNRRLEGSAQGSRQLMQRTPRRQSMLGTEAWDIAVSMDFRCFSNARVHALEQWMRLPKLRGAEAGCAAISKAHERLFSRRGSACIAGSAIRRAERRTGSRSLRFSGNPGKPLMRLMLPAPAAAGRCRMNSDRNDNARSLARRVEGQVHAMPSSARGFSGIPGISDRGRSVASDADPL